MKSEIPFNFTAQKAVLQTTERPFASTNNASVDRRVALAKANPVPDKTGAEQISGSGCNSGA